MITKALSALVALGWIVVFALFAQPQLFAAVVPSTMFGDHMVLQREMPVPVWGSAAPGESVSVRFAGNTASGKAGPDGKWQVVLPALTASALGRELTIEGSNTIVFKDVLVGEVWICSGQSNMQYGWGKESQPLFNWGGDAALAALVPAARTKPIRSFTVLPDVAFTPNDRCKGSWVTDVSGSAIAFGFSYHLNQKLNVPVGVIVTCWGSSSIEGWMPREMTAQLPHFKAIMDAFDANTNVQSRVRAEMEEGIDPGNVFVRQQPNLLYNAMLHPLAPYACRGMVWYQGEANAVRYAEYARSFPLWWERLRKEWKRDDFHLLAVMLPGYGMDDGHPDGRKSWAWFREVQMKILELPHTSVANSIDLGDSKNIHPADKAPICERLALLGCRDVYGMKISGQGPTYKSCSVKGRQLAVTFTHADGLKTTDGNAPKGFWLADKKRVWQPASASIKGDTVVLEADGLETPVACRYAFCGKPEVNLVNSDSLPAYPFRTDAGIPAASPPIKHQP